MSTTVAITSQSRRVRIVAIAVAGLALAFTAACGTESVADTVEPDTSSQLRLNLNEQEHLGHQPSEVSPPSYEDYSSGRLRK